MLTRQSGNQMGGYGGGIAEWLTINYAALAPTDKKAILEQSLQILEDEGFFGAAPGGED